MSQAMTPNDPPRDPRPSTPPPAQPPAPILMKCCPNFTHDNACAVYWHGRQRAEVQKRVEVENLYNALLIRRDVELASADQQLLRTTHAWALEDHARWLMRAVCRACQGTGNPFGRPDLLCSDCRGSGLPR